MAYRSVLWMTTLAFDRSFMFTSQARRHGLRSRMTSRNSQTVPNDARRLLRVNPVGSAMAAIGPVYHR
jgi:ribosomal protein L34